MALDQLCVAAGLKITDTLISKLGVPGTSIIQPRLSFAMKVWEFVAGLSTAILSPSCICNTQVS
jgi:hypothetical protein